MAFVEGPSLADKIKERPLPLDEALEVAIQIAEGLREAHEKGIVHRDVKPQNIMLTLKGQVKIMDFGLASLGGRSKLTKSGTTLGTPAYMAPEQLEAQEVDRRADLWAFGCVLYEMLTQTTPFAADYEQAIAYGILNEDPEPVTAKRSGLPVELDQVIKKALAKNAEQRYQHADDLLVDLRRIVDVNAESQAPAAPYREPRPIPWLGYVAVGLVAAIAGAFAALWLGGSEQDTRGPVRRYSFTPPSLAILEPSDALVAISPDGRHIVYASDEDPRRLWLRSLDNEQARPIAGSQGVSGRPFWSPDSRWIAYPAGDELKKVGLSGQPPVTLHQGLDARNLGFRGATWDLAQDRILLAPGATDNVEAIPARGGAPSPLFETVVSGLQPIAGRLHSLPSGKALLVDVGTATRMDLHLLHVDSGEVEKLADGLRGVYAPSGHIVYEAHANGGLWALPFSLTTLKSTGPPFPIVQGVGSPSVSEGGALVGVDLAEGGGERIIWQDRQGAKLGDIAGPFFQALRPALSPDGKRLAVELRQDSADAGDIWIINLDDGISRRLTSDPSRDTFPSWSPDGQWVAYRSDRGGQRDLWLVRADGEGDPLPFTQSANHKEFSSTWSPDGRRLLYGVDVDGREESDIWMLTLDANHAPLETQPFLETPVDETSPSISPDGSWVAYESEETGTPEVFVRDFPAGARARRISRNGGYRPQWGPGGAELVYLWDGMLEAVSIDPGTGAPTGEAEQLFEYRLRGGGTFFAWAPDGRFVGVEDVAEGGAEKPAIRVIENWYEAFRDEERD